MARQAIGKAEHRRISSYGDGIGIELVPTRSSPRAKRAWDSRPALASAALTAEEAHLEMRVILQQAQGLRAAVARGSMTAIRLKDVGATGLSPAALGMDDFSDRPVSNAAQAL